ncbi:ATP-binding protein [bacterium]|nr:ATP-binding protein [bacterium]
MINNKKNKTVVKVNGGMNHASTSILRSLNYKPETALAEFIDNSVQSYFDNRKLLPLNYKLKIFIHVSSDKKEIIITDNAAGISDKDLKYALMAGGSIRKNSISSLNEFGIGMKGAAFWFTKTWTIETKAINEDYVKIINMNINEIVKSKNGILDVKITPTKDKNSYTKIILKDCDKSVGRHKNIITLLESIHRNFLGSDIHIQYCYNKAGSIYANHKLKFVRPKYSREIPKFAYQDWLNKYAIDYESNYALKNKPKEVHWKIPIDISFGTEKMKNLYKAKGFVAKLVKSSENRGIYFFRRNKMIQGPVYPGEIYTSERGSGYEYKYIYGEINFDNVNSSITKDSLSISANDMNDFEIKLNSIIKDRNKFHGTSFWDQLRVGIDGYQELINNEKKISIGFKSDELNYRNTGFSLQKQFESIEKNIKDTKINRNPEDPLLLGHRETILTNKEGKVKIEGHYYKVIIKTTWDDDYFDTWLHYQLDRKNKKVYIQISLSHIFFKEFFFNATTSSVGKESIKNGIIILSEFLISSIIYSISVMGVKKADQVLNNLNSILRELPPSELRKKII